MTWESEGVTVPGLLYPPDDGPASPPLIVDVHGGPTGQATVRWDGWLRFFTSRGWAVLRPNPRGSTGYGRGYVQAAARRWGADDVEDVAAGIRAAGEQGWCDPERVAVAGGSSGGLTALLVCARHGDLVRAAVSAYGVTDLFDLARDDAPVRVPLSRRDRRPAPGRGGRLPRSVADHPRGRDPGAAARAAG